MPPKRKASKGAASLAQKKAKTEPTKAVSKATKSTKPTKTTPQTKVTKTSTTSPNKVAPKKADKKVEPVIEIEDTPSPSGSPAPSPGATAEPSPPPPAAVALPADFVGKYDLYGSSGLSYKHDDFLPASATEKPDFVNIHKKLLEKQKKRDWAARVAIRGSIDPDDEEFADWSDMGRFLCREMRNRAGGVLKPICIMDGETKSDRIEFDKKIAIHPSLVGEGPAYISDLTLGPIGREIECGMNWSHGGSLMMRKVWQGEDKEELFQVWFSFVIDFGVYFYERGRGTKDEYSYTYWAIRAAKNSRGEEIGISAEGDGKDTDEGEDEDEEDDDEW